MPTLRQQRGIYTLAASPCEVTDGLPAREEGILPGRNRYGPMKRLGTARPNCSMFVARCPFAMQDARAADFYPSPACVPCSACSSERMGLLAHWASGVSCFGRRGPRGDSAAWDSRLSRPRSWVCALLPGWDESDAKQPETEDEFF